MNHTLHPYLLSALLISAAAAQDISPAVIQTDILPGMPVLTTTPSGSSSKIIDFTHRANEGRIDAINNVFPGLAPGISMDDFPVFLKMLENRSTLGGLTSGFLPNDTLQVLAAMTANITQGAVTSATKKDDNEFTALFNNTTTLTFEITPEISTSLNNQWTSLPPQTIQSGETLAITIPGHLSAAFTRARLNVTPDINQTRHQNALYLRDQLNLDRFTTSPTP